MLRNALAWIRQHPVRCAVYALLVTGAVWAGLTARGILRGPRNALLTRVARAPLLRTGWIANSTFATPSTPWRWYRNAAIEIDVRGVNVDLAGSASGGVDEARSAFRAAENSTASASATQLIAVQTVAVRLAQVDLGFGILLE